MQPLEDFLASATSNDAAGITFVISLVIGLNGASGALAAAGRSLNVVLGVEDDRCAASTASCTTWAGRSS